MFSVPACVILHLAAMHARMQWLLHVPSARFHIGCSSHEVYEDDDERSFESITQTRLRRRHQLVSADSTEATQSEVAIRRHGNLFAKEMRASGIKGAQCACW